MRSHNPDCDLTRVTSVWIKRQSRLRLTQRAKGKFGVDVKHATYLGKSRVISSRSEQSDAERYSLIGDRCRQCEATQVEQIDEICIGAEAAVELDRIGQHFFYRVRRRCRRKREDVDRAEYFIRDDH